MILFLWEEIKHLSFQKGVSIFNHWTEKKKKDNKPQRAFYLVVLSIKIPSSYFTISYGCATFHITHPSLTQQRV